MVIKTDCEISDPIVFRGMKKYYPIIRAICMEWYPSAWKLDGKLEPESVVGEIRESGFDICDLKGDTLSDQDALQEHKQDVFLKNREYGYSR